MKKYLISTIILLTLVSCGNGGGDAAQQKEVDICVYGGTASGVIAAYSARMAGKTVLLVEPGKYLGGMTTGGLGWTDIGNKYAVTGLARLFYRRLGTQYGKLEQWTFPPSAATREINRFIADGNVDVLYMHRIIAADRRDATIRHITLEKSDDAGAPHITVKARRFIDCSYEGDLMARAGVSYFTGRESNERYDESLDGVQMSILHQFPDSIDPYCIEGDPSGGLCWGISSNILLPEGSGDTCIQAYNFRLCLTDNPANRRPFEKPASYDPSKYELLARAVRKMPPDINQYLLYQTEQPDAKYDVNNRGPLSTDMIGMNHDYPDGDYDTRARIWQEHVEYTKGLMYFMSHDERIPEALRRKVNELGWARDEFVDNDNFPTQLYVREARRLHGEYVMTQHNCQGEETVGDGVGMAAYGMDSHNCQRLVVNGMVKNEGDVEYGGFPPYPVSYRSLTPQRSECTNLLVPVCISSTHIAYGSIRMEPVFMVLGQSAAVAASLSIDAGCAVQDVDVTALRKILKDDPYLDGSTPEILVDDTDIDKVRKQWWWVKRFGAHYKTSFLYSENKPR
ncbi:MAG: FAD-dependent oxidoreductase, partial [Tannerella sp.]|nr:FAD-dependent oxidoreductase [Tannerella sp.]